MNSNVGIVVEIWVPLLASEEDGFQLSEQMCPWEDLEYRMGEELEPHTTSHEKPVGNHLGDHVPLHENH